MVPCLFFLAFGLVFNVTFAPGTKAENDDSDENKKKTLTPPPSTTNSQGENGELVRELSDAELRKIVAEQPLDDPLNAFFDPYEPYRLSTFAYWHPITFPKDHANPPLPVGFLPPNAPPKIFPSDFFFQDADARRIVLGEHAAAFCPYLRRWREKHPLKPYPVEADFLRRHHPIKFTPGKGYEIDQELKKIKDLTRKAEEEIMKEAEMEKKSAEIKANEDVKKLKKPETEVPCEEDVKTTKVKTETNDCMKNKIKGGKKKKKKAIWELGFMKEVIGKVMHSRPDCRGYAKFLETPLPTVHYLTTPPDCLQEVIFYMDEQEDLHYPVDIADCKKEIVNKVESYRQVLVKLYEFKIGKKKKGKCPFGFKGKTEVVDEIPVKIYQGTIPKWAELKSDEEIYSTDADADADDGEKMEKYRFAYKQVPFPSIQDTLKKYVSI